MSIFPSPRALVRLWPRIRPHRWRLLVATVCLTASAAIGLAFPQIVRYLLDAAFVRHDGALLDRIALGLVGLFTIQGLLNFSQAYLLSSAGERVIARLRQDLFEHLVRLSPGFFAERRTGELVSRLSADIGTMQGLVSYQISEFARQVLYFLGGVTLLTLTHPELTRTTLLVVPVVVGAAVFFGRRLRKISTGGQDKIAEARAGGGVAGPLLELPGEGGGGPPRVRAAGHRARDLGPAGAPTPASAGTGRRGGRKCELPIPTGAPACARAGLVASGAGRGGGTGRAIRGGQDDAREPAAALLGRDERPHHARRRGHPGAAARRSAAQHRHRAAGAGAVQRPGRGEHRVRAARSEPSGDRGRGPRGPRARVRGAAAAGLRDAGGGARGEALGGPAPADRDRAGAPQGPGGVDPRRSDVQPRRRERAADRSGPGAAPQRPHHADHRAPPVHRAPRRPAGRARPRACGRGGHARRAARPGTAVRAAVSASVPGRSSPRLRRGSLHEEELSLRRRRGHFRAALREKHVDLAPHAEATRQGDARLHREPDPRDERPAVGRLEGVEMRTRAVRSEE